MKSVLELDEETQRLVMSWDAFETLAQRIIEFARGQKFTGVYGFPRGGLVLAVKLSHALGLPLLMAPAKGCLICDDISDSGETLLKYISSDYKSMTLLMREGTKAIPDFYSELVTAPNWIQFPWEA